MENTAVLKIYGDIGEPDPMMTMFGVPDGSVSSKTISDFLDDHKEATAIVVKINSRGGDVQEGWAIYDLLVNSGKKIKTVGEGKVYSIATIIFLAGSEREMLKNADGLIHNPFIPPYTLADAYEATDLVKIAEGLAQEEEKILSFYAEKTGTAKEKLAEYMKEDTKLSAEDMVTLGFATKVIEPVKAYAYVKPINNFKMDEKAFFEKLGSTLDKAVEKIAGFSRISTKNQELTDMDGNVLTLEKETGVPAVGDKASPDGTFVMESGKTITVTGGVIATIEDTPIVDDPLKQAQERIAELEAQVAQMGEDNISASAEKETLAAETAKAVALVTELRNLKNSWKPENRGKGGANNKVDGIDLDRVKEIVELNKKS
jgi:ATP-dependent Clp protease protease subunit